MTARSDLNAHFTPLTASRAVSQVQCASPGQPRTSTSGFLTCTHPRAHATAASAQAGSNPCSYVTCTLRPASHWACLGSNVRFDSTFHFLPISRNITCPLISLVKVFLPKLHSTAVACSCSSFQASSQEDTRSVLEVKPLLNRLFYPKQWMNIKLYLQFTNESKTWSFLVSVQLSISQNTLWALAASNSFWANHSFTTRVCLWCSGAHFFNEHFQTVKRPFKPPHCAPFMAIGYCLFILQLLLTNRFF